MTPSIKLQPHIIKDFVLIRELSSKPGENKKFKMKYKGPYQVSKVLNKNRYVITDIPGFNVTTKSYNSILSSDKLKRWIKPVQAPEKAIEQLEDDTKVGLA